MGYETFIVKYPKYKDFTLRDYEAMEEYLSWYENEWARNNYATPQAFIANMTNRVFEDADIEFFKKYLEKANNNSIYTDVIFWGSDSREIFKIVQQYFNSNAIYEFKLSKNDVKMLLDILFKRVNDFIGREVYIENSFTHPEDEDIYIKGCDGVEIIDNEGNIKRLYSTREYSEGLLIIEDYLRFNMYFSFIRALVDCLNTDFEKEDVFIVASF